VEPLSEEDAFYASCQTDRTIKNSRKNSIIATGGPTSSQLGRADRFALTRKTNTDSSCFYSAGPLLSLNRLAPSSASLVLHQISFFYELHSRRKPNRWKRQPEPWAQCTHDTPNWTSLNFVTYSDQECRTNRSNYLRHSESKPKKRSHYT